MHPCARTTFGQVLNDHKVLKNSPTVAGRRVLYVDEKTQSRFGLSNGDTASAGGRHLAAIPAYGLFSLHKKTPITCKW
jgi:hypothetical protein